MGINDLIGTIQVGHTEAHTLQEGGRVIEKFMTRYFVKIG